MAMFVPLYKQHTIFAFRPLHSFESPHAVGHPSACDCATLLLRRGRLRALNSNPEFDPILSLSDHCEAPSDLGVLITSTPPMRVEIPHTAESLNILSHTHARVKVNCAQTCAIRQDREVCPCDGVVCLHLRHLQRESLFPVSETT